MFTTENSSSKFMILSIWAPAPKSPAENGIAKKPLDTSLFMDDLWIRHFSWMIENSMQELDSVVQTIRISSRDVGIQFGVSKCGMLEMEKGKVLRSEGIESPNGETIKSLKDKRGYKYLSVLQFSSI